MSKPNDFVSAVLPTLADVMDVVTIKAEVSRQWVRSRLYREVAGKLVPIMLQNPPNPADPSDISKFVAVSGQDWNGSRDVGNQAAFILQEFPGIGQVNTLTDFIELTMCYDAADGSLLLEVPKGYFCFILPDRYLAGAGNTWEITGQDQSYRIAGLFYDNVYTIPAGANVVDAVKTILMANKLPPSEGGPSPAGVPVAGSPQSTLPVYTGSSPLYTGGVPASSVGTLGTDGYRVMPNGLSYNPAGGARVDPTTYAPIDPWTNLAMAGVKNSVGGVVPNTFHASWGNLWYDTYMGAFVYAWDTNPGVNETTNPIQLVDPFILRGVAITVASVKNSTPYLSPSDPNGVPCALATFPYDSDHSGPYFTTFAASGSAPAPTATGNSVGYCPAGFAVSDTRSGCYYAIENGVAAFWHHATNATAIGAASAVAYSPSVCTKVDPTTGLPIDPVTCGPMGWRTVTDSTGTRQLVVTAAGYAYSAWTGDFYRIGTTPAAYVDPKTGATVLEGAKLLCAFGGDGGQVAAPSTIPSATGTAVPWPDPNNPGLTPSGCDFFGPGLDASRLKIPPSDITTPIPIKFDRKTNVWASLNALMTLIGYFPLGFDEYGDLVTGPIPWQYTSASGAAFIPSEGDWTYTTGRRSSIPVKDPLVERINDVAALYNVIKVEVQPNNGRPAIYVRRANHSPQSMVSIENLGYVRMRKIQDDSIPDIQTAILRCLVELQFAALGTQAIEFKTAINPFESLNWLIMLNVYSKDGVTLEIDSTGVNYGFIETAWSIDYSNYEQTHQVARLVAL